MHSKTEVEQELPGIELDHLIILNYSVEQYANYSVEQFAIDCMQ